MKTEIETGVAVATGEGEKRLFKKAAKQLEDCQCAGSDGHKLNLQLADLLKSFASTKPLGEKEAVEHSTVSGQKELWKFWPYDDKVGQIYQANEIESIISVHPIEKQLAFQIIKRHNDCVERLARRAEPQLEATAGLLEACQFLFDAIEDGTLVRDISRDSEPGWSMRMLCLTQGLSKALQAIDKAKASPQTDFSGSAEGRAQAETETRIRHNESLDRDRGIGGTVSDSENQASPAETLTQTDEELADEAVREIAEFTSPWTPHGQNIAYSAILAAIKKAKQQ